MKHKQLFANGILLLTALIWGTAFAAQRVGMDYIGPFTFIAGRFFLSSLMLVPLALLSDRMQKKETAADAADKKKQRNWLLLGGLCCGTCLFFGSTFQQVGLVFTTASKSAFITALYIVLVPLCSIFLRHRPSIQCWIGVILGAVGLYLLCITGSFQIAKGDFIVLIGAFFWTGHVLSIDFFLSKGVNAVKLSLLQFCYCTVLGLIAAFLRETPNFHAILTCAIPLLYAGCLSGGLGFTLQAIGQKYTNPTVASLLMSMESVFGALAGIVLLHEVLSAKELFGCIFLFAAILISQIPKRKTE